MKQVLSQQARYVRIYSFVCQIRKNVSLLNNARESEGRVDEGCVVKGRDE